MSSKIILDNITVKNNPAMFTEEISLQVTFTALEPISTPLSWKIIYDFDQTLEQFEIDPIESSSTLKFDISCECPDAYKIPRHQLLCVTALILTASYKQQEFIRVGYYIHNQLVEEQTEPTDTVSLSEIVPKIRRTIISDKPRITKFNIDWSEEPMKRKLPHPEDSIQSRLDDYFLIESKQKNPDSLSQKHELKQNDKGSINEDNELMITQ